MSEDVLAAPVGADVEATPAARQLAELLGIDLATVPAGGPERRVSRDDVARHARHRLESGVVDAPVAPEMPLLQTPASSIRLTGMRGTIASRMHASLRDMAQLTLTMDAVMDAVIEDRNSGRHDTKPGFTDYVIAAAAGALVDHPLVNSQIAEGRGAPPAEVNVGIAVALDGGLVVPVVANADALSLSELSAETTRLATAAREGGLALADLEGGTFSVTALGMFGVDAFTPVINPPNTAILGVGRLRDEVRWDGDTPVKTTVLTLSLTWDIAPSTAHPPRSSRPRSVTGSRDGGARHDRTRAALLVRPGRSAGRRVAAQHRRWQGRGPCPDDRHGPARAARIHPLDRRVS